MSKFKVGDKLRSLTSGLNCIVINNVNDNQVYLEFADGSKGIYQAYNFELLYQKLEEKEDINMREIVTLNDHRRDIQVTTTTKDKYPCLMIYNETMILFSSEHIGMVVGGKNPCWPIGFHSYFENMKEFKPYDKELVIKNQ